MDDGINHNDAAAHAAAYRGVRERVNALVAAVAPDCMEVVSPATPQWRARDVLAHLTGVATDVVNGNVAGASSDAWTAAQVGARTNTPVAALLDEWNESGAKVDAFVLALPTVVTGQLVADAVTHEHDLRLALGRPGARSSDALELGVGWVIGALGRTYDDAGRPALRVETDAVAGTAGSGPVEATLRASTFEVARAIAGRRTLAEIAAYDWSPAPRAEWLLLLEPFTATPTSLGE